MATGVLLWGHVFREKSGEISNLAPLLECGTDKLAFKMVLSCREPSVKYRNLAVANVLNDMAFSILN